MAMVYRRLNDSERLTFHFDKIIKSKNFNADDLCNYGYWRCFGKEWSQADFLKYGSFVDENLENYLQVHNWLRGLGFPESIQEFIDLKTSDTYSPDPSAKNALNEYSDATLFIYNSNFNEIAKVKFKDVFPVALSTINFSATTDDINYVTAEATFKYSIYDIEVLT